MPLEEPARPPLSSLFDNRFSSVVLSPLNMLPKTPPSNAQGYSQGALVAFDQEARTQIGVILECRAQKARVLNMRGRELDLPFARLDLLPENCSTSLIEKNTLQTELEALLVLAEETYSEVKIEEVWLTLHQEKQSEYSCTELSELYFGETTNQAFLKMKLALNRDEIFFKRKKHLYEVRHSQVVEELKKAALAREEQNKIITNFIDFVESNIKSKTLSTPQIPEELRPLIEIIEKSAAGVSQLENSARKMVANLLEACENKLSKSFGKSREEKCFSLLKQIGVFHKNTNLSLIRNDAPGAFGKGALTQAQALREPGEYDTLSSDEKAFRRDLTHLECFTIDDSSTMDMDDALSIRAVDNGYELGIHISDVAHAFEFESPLDKEALARATSIYCPEITFNMLPTELCADKLSLVADKPRRALSAIFHVDQSYQPKLIEFVPSLVKVREKFNYDHIDEVLLGGGDRTFEILYNIASNLEAERISNGAAKIPKRDTSIYLEPQDDFRNAEVRIEELDENSPARSLIGEMMILLNGAAAELAVKKGIPLVFRSQESSDQQQSSPTAVEDGPATEYIRRTQLKRSMTSTTAGPHATLGLDAYAQVTSPIRRYTDLWNQRQLLHLLRSGNALFSPEETENIIELTMNAGQRARVISREAKRFWLLRYLQKRAESNKEIGATVLRTDLKNYLIELEEIYMPTMLKVSEKLKVGEEITVSIDRIDPQSDYLKLRLISN